MWREHRRVPWTPQEDERLRRFVATYGRNDWSTAPHRAKLLRDSLSCRERWHLYLGPGIRRGPITPEEEDLIIRLHAIHGDCWCEIAWNLPGRTAKDVKFHWRSHLSQRLVAQGVDPRTHEPIVEAAGSSQSSDASAAGLGITELPRMMSLDHNSEVEEITILDGDGSK